MVAIYIHGLYVGNQFYFYVPSVSYTHLDVYKRQTFTMYLLEQIDMHIFGGNAMLSLSAALYCVFRSCLAVAVLYGFAYGGLSEAKSSQHILFSMFCGLLIATAYHLSRSWSDPTPIWNILKTHLWPAEEDFHEAQARKTDRKKQHRLEKLEKNPSNAKALPQNVQTPAAAAAADKKQTQGKNDTNEQDREPELVDPLPEKLQRTVNAVSYTHLDVYKRQL